ncbi:hypothetical protein EMIHUDRAFT_199214 [Emiliania huxleyi CCMP1516]|uniref:Ion transport domain-containing protein n=2 Tax=Emiliania huxleyi TaxID=2903 RepID=A0A0D3I2H1_EMIH1|nr:hypothetical protein EMIHUDRAFT_199214 [Emiliania huxleyi CCMP1516]EOD05456.1 hypothetical protein EMIHUDRAFT_199214 [Emiliania huxleyi CCMP1516]|eukprot:XP_005757885.1 hypothetical protein EMIHUDRAFT_199214 [Emiliania huxleyi CCMP1516]
MKKRKIARVVPFGEFTPPDIWPPFAVTEVDNAKMVGWIPTPHVEARTTQRGAVVQRPEVEDEHVPWSEAAPGYSPHTTEFPFAWKTGEQGSDWTAALQKSFQPGGTGAVRLNPGGRTGLVGGWSANARAGANQAVDPIITRFKPGSKETLQLLASLRRECNAWALPGAMVRYGESDETAMRRGLAEKGVSREISDLILPPSPPVAVAATQATAKPSTVTTQAIAKPSTGYTDDSRNSDDAWIETTVYRFHLDGHSETNISSPGVKWVDISELGVAATRHIFSPHRIWVNRVADEILKAPTLEKEMRAVTLRLLFRPLTLSLGAVRFVGVGALGCGEEHSKAQAIASAAISSVTHVELRLCGPGFCSLRSEVIAQVQAVQSEGVEWVRCRCAPFAPVVVGWESRSRLSIPQDATHQAFVYGPLDEITVKDGNRDPQTEPFVRLLVNGGFVYVDCEGQEAKVVGVTYVDAPDVNAKDLYSKNHAVEFKGPHRMEERFRRCHAEKGHWTPVTLSFLRDAGVGSFMWLNPGESAGTHPIKLGAFAYSSAAADDDSSASAVYYILKSEDDLRGASARVDLDSAGVKLPVEDDRLLPEELVESQLTKHKAAAAPSRTGILSRSFSLAELSPRAAGEINRLDVPADSSSLTPLMMAAKLGHCDVVRTLLRRGASPMARAQDGSTAIDFALHDDELSVEQLLHKLDAAIALVPALFRHSAGEALCYVTMIAARAHIVRERRERSSPADANQLQGRADRAELLGIELFKTLSVVQRTILLEREPCRATTIPEVSKAKVGRPRGFVARAVNTPCQKTLLGDPTVQAAVNFRWYGPLIDSVLNGYVVTPNGNEERVETFSSNDLVKKGELFGIGLALCSKLAPAYNTQMLSFGLLLMWLSWFMRIFSLCGLGTLTVMLEKMLSDTVQFLVFMVGCAVAFAAALHQLFPVRDVLEVEGCEPFGDFSQGILSTLKRLLKVAIDPAESIDCAGLIAGAQFHFTAPFIVSVYVTLSVILLLNMLIAIMAKTFDNVWDKADDENRYLKAQLAVQYFGETYFTPPPPFNLLRLPFSTLSTLVDPGAPELLRRLWARTRGACELIGSFCVGAGRWLLWFICLPRLAVWVLQRAWAHPYPNHAPEEGLLSSEGESTDRYGLDPSNVRYVDGVGQLWSERNTVEMLIKLEEEIERKQAEIQKQHEEGGGR